MKEYLKMSDCFEMPLDGAETNNGRYTMLGSDGAGISCEFACDAELEVVLHAINSHDELVSEVDRLTKLVETMSLDMPQKPIFQME